jgi:hypothetical protein
MRSTRIILGGVMKKIVAAACAVTFGLLAACAGSRGPVEYSDDGLLRMPSRAEGGVYRLADWPYSQYKQVIVEPLVVSFIKDWEKNHREVPAKEVKRIREEMQTLFREQLTKELVTRGKYKIADAPGHDVLMLEPRCEDLDIVAPDANTMDTKTLAPGPPKMKLVTEMRDSVTGTLVGRVIMFSGQENYSFDQLRIANRVTNAHDIGLAFTGYTQLLRETLNVARTSRPKSDLPHAEAPK